MASDSELLARVSQFRRRQMHATAEIKARSHVHMFVRVKLVISNFRDIVVPNGESQPFVLFGRK